MKTVVQGKARWRSSSVGGGNKAGRYARRYL